MDVQLETLRNLPPYLAPVDLAHKAQPLLADLKQLQKRLKKVRKRAQKYPQDMTLVWQVESEIRDFLKKHSYLGLRRLSQTEFHQALQNWEDDNRSLESRVSFWDDLSLGSVVAHFRQTAIEQASRPVCNPFRDAECNRLLQVLTTQRPRWKQIAETLVYIARVQKQKVQELQQMLQNIQTTAVPHELDAWVAAIEAVTPGKDDPYATLREVAYWLTDGFGLIGYWAQKHLWPRTEKQKQRRKYALISIEVLSAIAVIATSILSNQDSLIGDIARGIAMPYMAYMPYIAYVSYRMREVAGSLPKHLKRITWQYRVFYAMLWIMMLGPYLLHRWLPRTVTDYALPIGRDQRLRQAINIYVDTLLEKDTLEKDKKGHVLADMLKARHQLVALRRRFEIIPLTVISELSDDRRYVVIDLTSATPEGLQHWCQTTPLT